MNHAFRKLTLGIVVILSLASCTPPQHIKEAWGNAYKPINVLPMYGAPYVEKTEQQLKSDDEFIQSVIKSEGSREVAAKRFSGSGWKLKRNGDLTTAMMRFNQSWLLDPNYYQPYWGFASILLAQKKPEKASVYFDKAIKLINDNDEETKLFKPWIFVDAARAYGWTANLLKETDIEKSKALYEKADKLIDDALRIDPKVGRAYKIGGIIAYDQGNYRRAWNIVKKSRKTGAYEFSQNFIEQLSKVYPE